MFFNSLDYFVFFMLTWITCSFVSRPAWILLPASVVFYLAAGWYDHFLIAGLIVSNWVILRRVHSARYRVILAVVVNIGVLVGVKYQSFLIG